MSKDQVYAKPHPQVEKFAFDERVASVFDDMIRRSVPGYAMMLEMIGVITARFVSPGSHCYDLGCSLGASTLSIRHNLPSDDCRIIAIDNSEAMIERCRANIDADNARSANTHQADIELRCEDLLDSEIDNAALTVMNFTLQFIAPEQRQALLQRLYQGLKPGGVLILSEKISPSDAQDDALLIELYHDFKRLRGYSDLEIAQKRNALEEVLIPDSPQTHLDRLHQAGFEQVTPWFQCFNFMSLLAQK